MNWLCNTGVYQVGPHKMGPVKINSFKALQLPRKCGDLIIDNYSDKTQRVDMAGVLDPSGNYAQGPKKYFIKVPPQREAVIKGTRFDVDGVLYPGTHSYLKEHDWGEITVWINKKGEQMFRDTSHLAGSTKYVQEREFFNSAYNIPPRELVGNQASSSVTFKPLPFNQP